jgi:hypothetical protein
MKKLMIALAIVFSISPAAFAGKEKVKPGVLNAFRNRFGDVGEVKWTAGLNYYRAAFIYQGSWMHAYYNKEAELVGMTRNLSITQLPVSLQSSLKTRYPGYWITGLLELSGDEGYGYYLTIQNADTRIILESKNGYDWCLFQ